MIRIGTKIDDARIDGSLNTLKRDLAYFSTMTIEAVELPVHGLDAIRNGKLDLHCVRGVREILRAFSFCYSVHAPAPLNLMDENEFALHLAVFRASLDFTLEIGARILVYHPGRFVPEESFAIVGKRKRTRAKEQRLLAIEGAALLELAREYPEVTICLENARPYRYHSPYSYAGRLEALKAQVLNIDRPNVRINLDIGHLQMAAQYYGFDPVEAVADIRDLIAHTHIHDNFGGAVHFHERQQTHQIPFGRGDAHMPIGWGTIPFDQILGVYVPDYTGILMMELHSRYYAHIEESKFNLQRLLESLEFAEAGSA